MPSEKPQSNQNTINELLEQFCTGSVRKRRSLIASIEDRAGELASLGSSSLLSPFDRTGDDWAAGWILQVLQLHQPQSVLDLLPDEDVGWFQINSDAGIDYEPLQRALLEQRFEDADRFTSSKLRQLAGAGAETRGYVYFSEVKNIPGLDLKTIDRLWNAYSQGKFGFSVQARLLNSLGGRYERLWPRIDWKIDGEWTRYPRSFNWSLAAAEGHMPLVNQLRGVRLMDAILNHSAIQSRVEGKTIK